MDQARQLANRHHERDDLAPTDDWVAAALTNYNLVAAQYPRIAINPELRTPAIADIEAFLDMDPRKCGGQRGGL